MLNLNLDGFVVLKYQPGSYSRSPELTVRPDMLIFNSAVMKKLGDPNFIRLLFDASGKRLAIQGKSKESKETINLSPGRKAKNFSVYDTALVQSIMSEMGMSTSHRYKADGVLYEEENIMIFDLAQTTKSDHKPVKH